MARNEWSVISSGSDGKVLRQRYFVVCTHQYFGGTDLYYIPFITPTVEPKFTDRHLKELSPEVNAGIPVVPQLLSNRSADFIWAAKALQDLGYKEVNLNPRLPFRHRCSQRKRFRFFKRSSRIGTFPG